MNLKTMNPADRAKAAMLIGAIVLALFFFIHTMLGALSPKKPADSPASGTAASNTAPGGPPPPPAAPPTSTSPAVTAQSAFPSDKVSMIGSKDLRNSNLGLDVNDPFAPIPGTDTKGKNNTGSATSNSAAPDIKIAPVKAENNPPALLPPLGAPPASQQISNAMILKPVAPAEPQIKLIGIIQGDKSIASLAVDTRSLIAQPGDPLANGYRLISVDENGVCIRHRHTLLMLKVGDVLNPSASLTAAPQ